MNEFEEREAKRQAVTQGVNRLLRQLDTSRAEYPTLSDAEILRIIGETFNSDTALALANTARELDQVTPASSDGFIAAKIADLDTEAAASNAAHELAASWQ